MLDNCFIEYPREEESLSYNDKQATTQ